jgi:hypothetical protein
MPHTTSNEDTPMAGPTEVDRHLTESVLMLQQTIRNIREDVANGIAPSILMPADSVSMEVFA